MEEDRNNGIGTAYNDPESGRFIEGNPGRPLGAKNFTTKVREALEKVADGQAFSYEEALVKKVLALAINDGDPKMIKLIWNYLDGMPTQKIVNDDPRAEENRKSLKEIADVLNRRNKDSQTDS